MLSLDPEFAAIMAPLAEAFASKPKLPPGDVEGRRESAKGMFDAMRAGAPAYPNVTRTKHDVQSSDGATITVSEFRTATTPRPSKAVYYIHGGGMIMGSVDMFEKGIQKRAEELNLPVFAVSYRLAPEFPHPTPVEDCFAGLKWLYEHAEELGVDKERIVVLGESTGGGLAAGTALLARDRSLNPPLLKQVLIFPMIDDRNTTPFPEIEPFAIWKNDDNITGWRALLGSSAGGPNVSEYAAPARATNLAGLPPTYIECGQLDIFLNENLEYATRLAKAQVPIELHIYPGQVHGFQMLGAQTSYARMALENAKGAILRA